MKISKVSVEELFGSYSYELQILTDKNITILDAPNGMGKTTVLGMIHAALKQDIDFLDAVPFRRFTIFFDENSNRCRYISGSGEEQVGYRPYLTLIVHDIGHARRIAAGSIFVEQIVFCHIHFQFLAKIQRIFQLEVRQKGKKVQMRY